MNPKAFLSQESEERQLFTARIRVAVGVALALLLVLVGRLAYIQVGRHAHFATLARDNLTRPVPLPPARGLILDRHGVVLAGNFPAYTVSIAPRAASRRCTPPRDLPHIDPLWILHGTCRARVIPFSCVPWRLSEQSP